MSAPALFAQACDLLVHFYQMDEFAEVEGSFAVEVSWEGEAQEKFTVRLLEFKLPSGSPASQAEAARAGLFFRCPAPAPPGPGLRNWKEPTEWPPFKPVPAPGTCPSLPDSRAISASRRLNTAQPRPVCFY